MFTLKPWHRRGHWGEFEAGGVDAIQKPFRFCIERIVVSVVSQQWSVEKRLYLAFDGLATATEKITVNLALE